MILLTKEIERKMPPIGKSEKMRGRVKFFDPTGSWIWYAAEGERQAGGGYMFFGVVCGWERELGYFTLHDLEHAKDGIKGLQGLPIERDLYFEPKPLSECV